MPVRVKVEGQGTAVFPDGTPPDVIKEALSKKFGTPKPEGGSADVVHYTAPAFGEGPTAAEMLGKSSSGRDQPEGTEDSFFLKTAKQGLESAAHPQTLGDFLSLALPGSEGVAAKSLGAVGRGAAKVGRGMEAAGDSLPMKILGNGGAAAELYRGNLGGAAMAAGASPAMRYLGKGLQWMGGKLAPIDRAAEDALAVRQFTGGKTTASPAPIIAPNAKPDVWDRVRATEQTPVRPRAASVPIDQGLPPAGSTLSPRELAELLRKKGNDVVSGGPSSARALEAGSPRPISSPTPLGSSPVGSAPAPSSDILERLIGKNKLIRVKPEGIPEDIWRAMRDMKGARDVARPLGLTPEQVRKLSGGGPSKIPIEALERMQDIARQAAQKE